MLLGMTSEGEEQGPPLGDNAPGHGGSRVYRRLVLLWTTVLGRAEQGAAMLRSRGRGCEGAGRPRGAVRVRRRIVRGPVRGGGRALLLLLLRRCWWCSRRGDKQAGAELVEGERRAGRGSLRRARKRLGLAGPCSPARTLARCPSLFEAKQPARRLRSERAVSFVTEALFLLLRAVPTSARFGEICNDVRDLPWKRSNLHTAMTAEASERIRASCSEAALQLRPPALACMHRCRSWNVPQARMHRPTGTAQISSADKGSVATERGEGCSRGRDAQRLFGAVTFHRSTCTAVSEEIRRALASKKEQR